MIKNLIFIMMVINIFTSCKKPYNDINETNNNLQTEIASNYANENEVLKQDNKINKEIAQKFLNINNEVQPGTAGTSLKATIFLANVLDSIYENKNDIDINQIILSIKTSIDKSDDNFMFEFEESIQSIRSILDVLQSDENNLELLDTAGVNQSHFPWDDKTFEITKNITENLEGI